MSYASSFAGALAALTLVACGDPGAQSPEVDASSPDAASTDDAQPQADAGSDVVTGTVTVLVTLDDVPTSAIRVISHDAAGSPLAVVTTDAAGHATLEVPVGGMITTLRTSCGLYAATCMRTIMGVQPGDAIHVRLTTSTIPPEFVTRVRTPGPMAGANGYLVSNGCASASTVSGLGDYVIERAGTPDCFDDPANPRLHVLGIARANGVPIAFSRLDEIPVPDRDTPVQLPAWSDATQPYALTFDSTTRTTPWFVSVAERQGRAAHPLQGGRRTTREPFTVVRPGQPGTGVMVYSTLQLRGATEADLDTAIVREHRGPATETSHVIDTREARFTTATGLIEGGRASVTWAFDGAPGDLDGALMTLEAGNLYGRMIWSLLGPPSPTTVFPRLPAELESYEPHTFQGYGLLYLSLYGSSRWDGFLAMRRAFLVDTFESRHDPAAVDLDAQEYRTSTAVPPLP